MFKNLVDGIVAELRVPASVLIEDVHRTLLEQSKLINDLSEQFTEANENFVNHMYPDFEEASIPTIPTFSPPFNDLAFAKVQQLRETLDDAVQEFHFNQKLLEYLDLDPERKVNLGVSVLGFHYTTEERQQPDSLLNNLEPDDDWNEDEDDWDDDPEFLRDDL